MEPTRIVIRNLQLRGYRAVKILYNEHATGHLLSADYNEGTGVFWVVGDVPEALQKYSSPIGTIPKESMETLNSELKRSLKAFTRPV